MLNMKPSANAMRNNVDATLRGTPVVIMIGNTTEPTMMIAPRPESDVKRTATTAHTTSASANGRSPPYSAARFTSVRAMPVSSATRPSSAPKMTAT